MLSTMLNKTVAITPGQVVPELAALQSRSFFIAACLKMSEAVLPHWIAELLRLIMALRKQNQYGEDNIFVSIYESGSTDHTHRYLDALKSYLKFLGVGHSIKYGTLV